MAGLRELRGLSVIQYLVNWTVKLTSPNPPIHTTPCILLTTILQTEGYTKHSATVECAESFIQSTSITDHFQLTLLSVNKRWWRYLHLPLTYIVQLSTDEHESEDSNFNTLDKAKPDTPFSEHMWSLYTFNHVTRKFTWQKQCAHNLLEVTAHYTIQLLLNKPTRCSCSEISPTRCNNCVLFFAMALLYMFRVTISPIIRSTYALYGHR